MGRSLNDDTMRSTDNHRDAGERVPQESHRDNLAQDSRTAYHLRGQNYRLNSSQSVMLQDLGAFRTITADSLRKHLYHDDEERFRKDLRNLTDQRLVTVQPDSKAKGSYVALTRAGKGLTEANFHTNPDQPIYSGIVKKSGNCATMLPSMTCTRKKRRKSPKQAAHQSGSCSILN